MASNIKVYDIAEVMDILGVSQRTVYNWLRAGKIKAFKVGKEWRITEDALREFTKKGTKTTGSPDNIKGFSNYPTWCLFYWLTRLEGQRNKWLYYYNDWVEHGTDRETALEELGNWIKRDLTEDNFPDLQTGLYKDLLEESLNNINYFEVVDAITKE